MAAAFSAWQEVTVIVPGGGCSCRGYLPRFARPCAALLVLTLIAFRSGAEPPAGRQEPRDIELELHARAALQRDRELVSFNLFVRVERGVATVSGPVSSRELGERAVRILKKVRDIHEVRNRTRVESFAAEKSLDSLLAGLGDALRLDLHQLLFPSGEEDDGSGLLGALRAARPPREAVSARPEMAALGGSTRGPSDVSTRSAVSLGPPVVLSDSTMPNERPLVSSRPGAADTTVSLPTRTHTELRREVERLLDEVERFGNLRVEVRQGVVKLTGRIIQAEQLIRLAGAISRVPGVREVDISAVQTSR
jgi:osmotically-inducible protein OsmY